MSAETALRVGLRNQASELARVAQQLGNAGVNIRAVAGVASDSESRLEFLVDNITEATRAWREAGTSFDEVQVALVWLPDTPRTLARASQALADARVNIESTYIARTEGGRAQVGFGCADAQKADQLLAGVAHG
jgi:hypothetical protein